MRAFDYRAEWVDDDEDFMWSLQQYGQKGWEICAIIETTTVVEIDANCREDKMNSYRILFKRKGDRI